MPNMTDAPKSPAGEIHSFGQISDEVARMIERKMFESITIGPTVFYTTNVDPEAPALEEYGRSMPIPGRWIIADPIQASVDLAAGRNPEMREVEENTREEEKPPRPARCIRWKG